MQLGQEYRLDRKVVSEIVETAKEQQVSTTAHFGQFVRCYLAAGFPREVAEAHRQYFDRQEYD